MSAANENFHDDSYEQELTFKQYFANIWNSVSTVFKGLMITIRYVYAVKPVSIEYPEVREVLPEKARMRLFNDVDNCIACTQCALACPVDCIYLASVPKAKDAPEMKTTSGHPLRLDLTQFVIDTSLCCYCGLCTTVCPTECLTHSHEYEFAQYTVDAMKYDYLAPDIKAWKQRIVKT